MTVATSQIKTFQKEVYRWFQKNQRSLPWRAPTLCERKDGSLDPYKILVSEVMLQQTQVARVVEKYDAFIKKFPNVQTLAQASLIDVLQLWQGLGYNRRGKALHESAQNIVTDFNGTVPTTQTELELLPGIGPYTAGAVRAFAFNQPAVFIETNIRTVYFHYFFTDSQFVSDKELYSLVDVTLDRQNPRRWYTALMDYGSHLKSNGVRVNSKSTHYTKQSKFIGSDRQIRGALLQKLITNSLSTKALRKALPQYDSERIAKQLQKLEQEGMVQKQTKLWQVAE